MSLIISAVFPTLTKKILKIEVNWVLSLLLATTAEMDVWRKTKSMYVQSDISYSLYFQLWWSVWNLSATQGHPPCLPFPFMIVHSIQYQSPPCSENKHFPPFYSSTWENTKCKSSAQNIAAPTLLPRGNFWVCVTSGATPALTGSPKSTLGFSGWFQAGSPGRIPLNYPPVDPFILREHSCLPLE